MDLTVAICTYKRLALLRTTLESIAACDPIDAQWELLVVDNECHVGVQMLVEMPKFETPGSKFEIQRVSAGTSTCVFVGGRRNFWSIRYIPEPTTGTSHARNRAVAEAKAPIILFTDDDVTFDRAWLVRMWQHIRAQPQCAFWGGRVEPVWSAPQPKWFDPSLCPMLGDTIVQYQRGDTPRAWNPAQDPPFYTANLAFRIDAIRAAGNFDTTVGHRGNVRMGMEDSLMVKAIAKAGGQGFYAADAIVHHPVPPERMERKYARQFAWRQGWLSAEMTRRGDDGSRATKPGKVPRWFYRAALQQWLRGFAQMIAGALTFNPAKRFAGRFTAAFGLSKLWHAMKG